jgi:hypothetical protein
MNVEVCEMCRPDTHALRHLCCASAIRHGAILQPPLQTAAVLYRPVSAGILSRTGKKGGYRKSRRGHPLKEVNLWIDKSVMFYTKYEGLP